MGQKFLKDLFPQTVTFRGTTFRLLKDKSIRDSIFIAAAATQAEAFLTKGGKSSAQANFFGDMSLVREHNIFMVLQVSIFPRLRQLTPDEAYNFYNRGYFEFKVIEPEKVTVDEDILMNVFTHIDVERFVTAGGVDAVTSYGRDVINRRTYLITENKFVPGGRSIQFVLNWTEAGGAGLQRTTEFCVEFFGAEYEAG
jgi:hypothetical protein